MNREEPLKITRISATPLAVPFKQTHVTWTGAYSAKSTLLIEIFTDEGIVGLGEAPGIPLPEMVAMIVAEFEEFLIGRDPFEINAFQEQALNSQSKAGLVAMTWNRFRNVANSALGGIDMALWDIVGKATGQSLCRLLGGKLRDRVDMFAWVHRKDTDGMVKEALEFQKQGFRAFYLKIGLGLQRDMQDIAALREALGAEALIRGDANGAWTPVQAVQEIRALERFGLDWVEQPVTEDDFDGFERVSRAVAVPLCIDQGVNTNQLAYQAISRRLADVVCSDLHRVGGLMAFRELAGMARLANIGICRHAGPEFGISAAAHLHLIATIPNLTLGNQTYATTIADDVVNETVSEFEEGALPVPDRPGIGVTLNPDKVAKYSEMYRKMREAR
ncbi:MAG: mandelate racemase/muconate lactonizing enzyme family protein [Betaproteobacteria bacterium]|nr:mandelate racemase/muconate lactonizing enzyme family protein [Betaproteobacteria bacterium]